jgi:hypothetical protein
MQELVTQVKSFDFFYYHYLRGKFNAQPYFKTFRNNQILKSMFSELNDKQMNILEQNLSSSSALAVWTRRWLLKEIELCTKPAANLNIIQNLGDFTFEQ